MYFIGTIPVCEYDIKHWGVIGMKWGLRRYQNPDGTLTPAGKARYGDVGHYEYRSMGQKLATYRQKRLENKALKLNRSAVRDIGKNYDGTHNVSIDPRKLEKSERLLEKARKQQQRVDAYKLRDNDRLEYAKRTSWGKAIAQKVLLGPFDVNYQRARSRGASRVAALFSGPQTYIGVSNIAVANYRKYGQVMLT